MKKIFDITGMTCAACAAHVEKAAKGVDGVQSAEVSLLLNRLTVETDAADGDIIAAVERVGYGASVAGERGGAKAKAEAGDKPKDYAKTLLWRFVLSLTFLVPLMYFSMGHMVGLPMGALDPHKNPASFALIQFVLTTPVLIINGRFFVSGVKSVLHKSANMDTLVSLGSCAAYIYGIVLLFVINGQMASGNVHAGAQTAMGLFFESAATILALVTLGKFLEAKSKGKTRSEVDKLLRLRPQTATVLRDGMQQTISIDDIAVGDTVVVMPGEYVPCDGVITSGATTLDKSAITGESMPEEATVGSLATSAVLNITGRVEMRAQSVGKDTTLSKIIELIENAGGSKAPIQKIADKVSAVFVPTVCALALVTLVVWLIIGTVAQALTMAISVLVISCPCALGLATPVAVMAGTGRAAAHGVLVKNAEVLQGLESVEIFALDKTATITEGKPRVTQIRAYGDLDGDGDTVLAIAAALERASTHPLANAVIEAATEKNITEKTAADSAYRIGYGMVGTVDGVEYALGGARLMSEFGVTVDDDGAATVFLCKRGSLLGAITVEDEIRPTSRQAIERIKSVGARVVMITGDGKEQAKRIAAKAGITEVYCNVLPDGKLDIVEKLKAQGKTAMVGDGINDAPALKAADVGIAIGSGTDVAIEAADVVLVKSDLGDVPRAMAVSHMTLRNVKQNLFWAFIYNALGIPLAAGVLYAVGVTLNPMIAAAAMAFSSLFVVCNALRLTAMKFDDKRVARKLKKIKRKTVGGNAGADQLVINDQGIGGNNMKTVLKVEGMSCGHCSARVQKALAAVAGVTNAEVDLASGTATVEGDFDVAAAVAAVENAGYDCKA
ncbi:MAG: cadmium-translocating P-type ATPase [Clostridiales bacterium]|nr:cadmium-translocating P-type ATPase [Clostridiales bacterium]